MGLCHNYSTRLNFCYSMKAAVGTKMNAHGCVPVNFIKTVVAGFGLWTIVCQSLDQTLRRAVRIHEKVLSSGLIIDLCFRKFALISVLRMDRRRQ